MSSTVLNNQRDRFDLLIDISPSGGSRGGGLRLRRVKGALLLVAAVVQAWAGQLGGRARRPARSDAGMTTAEYAVGTVAACGFAALLYKVVTSGAVSSALNSLVTRALHAV